MENLRGWTSGLGVPTFVVDTSGGKIPIFSNYVVSKSDNGIVLKNYKGKEYSLRWD